MALTPRLKIRYSYWSRLYCWSPWPWFSRSTLPSWRGITGGSNQRQCCWRAYKLLSKCLVMWKSKCGFQFQQLRFWGFCLSARQLQCLCRATLASWRWNDVLRPGIDYENRSETTSQQFISDNSTAISECCKCWDYHSPTYDTSVLSSIFADFTVKELHNSVKRIDTNLSVGESTRN